MTASRFPGTSGPRRGATPGWGAGRPSYQHVFPVADVPRLYEFCNTWNRDQLWPKAYVHVTDDGSAVVVGEVNSDWEHDLTPEQLDQVLLCGIATGCRLGEALGELKNTPA